ncbi:porin family protein [Portibacter marinus]|uniref:porin family protein n=1 Tax=Portibacter marinus TaxID=2898660 RepID=UPI001F36A5C0|nr:porin family protein [Portibacter marinus]
MNTAKIAFFILISFISVEAQSFFKGSAIIGVNASQIDGDDLAGYHKYGLTAGVKVEFPLSPSFDLGLEFLYCQRGSRTALIYNIYSETYRFGLNYISMPLILKWNDWWVPEESYYKVNLHGGLANAYLISSDTEESPIPIDRDLNDYDLSLVLGGGFAFSKNWSISLRYSRSLTTLYELETFPGRERERLLGYFLTLRTEYTF